MAEDELGTKDDPDDAKMAPILNNLAGKPELGNKGCQM